MLGFGINTGMEYFIMQSQQNADTVIEDFENAIAAGYNPNTLVEDILAKHNLTEDDFTESDIKRINRTVSEVWESKMNEGRRFY